MVYVFLAEGFEEIEALTPVDYLRRAGIEVTTVSVTAVNGRTVTGSHGIPVTADAALEELVIEDAPEALFLPGGMPGTKNLGASRKLCGLLTDRFEKGSLIAAICAAPSVLGDLGILKGKKATCFPGFEDRLTGAEVGGRAVLDGNVLTGCSAGAAEEFTLKFIEALRGKEAAEKIAAAVICR